MSEQNPIDTGAEWWGVRQVAAALGLTPQAVYTPSWDERLQPEITYGTTGKRLRRYRAAHVRAIALEYERRAASRLALSRAVLGVK